MSKKNNISYIKPKEPAFLARLKAEAGYKEGPSVDTKKEQLPTLNSSDESDGEDLPQVVVLKPGDLTKEEADAAAKDAEEAPADLNKKVVFKKPVKSAKTDVVPAPQTADERSSKKRTTSSQESTSVQKKQRKQQKNLLSFDEDEED